MTSTEYPFWSIQKHFICSENVWFNERNKNTRTRFRVFDFKLKSPLKWYTFFVEKHLSFMLPPLYLIESWHFIRYYVIGVLRLFINDVIFIQTILFPIYNRIFFWLFYCLVHQKVQVIKYSNEICVFSFWLKCDAFHLAFSKCLLVLTLLHDLKTTSNHWIYTNNCLYCMELAFCGLRTTSEQNSIMLWLFKEFTWIWNWCAWHETMCSMLVRMLCRFT